MLNRSGVVTELGQRHGIRLPPTFLQFFLLLVLASTYVTGNGTRAVSYVNTEQCRPNHAGAPTTEAAAATEAAPERARLPLQSLKTWSLLQTARVRVQSRMLNTSEKELPEAVMVTKGKKEEAKEEENAAEEMGKNRGSQKGRRVTQRVWIVRVVHSVRQQVWNGPMAGPLQAFLLGLVSAASLPIGAFLGLLLAPVPPRFVALCMAFGSGALVYAVATDLFGEAIHRLQDAQSSDERTIAACGLLAETGSGLFGALLYLGLNRLLEDHNSDHHSETLATGDLLQPQSFGSYENGGTGDLPAARVNATWTATRGAIASFHHEARIVSNRARNVAMSMWLGVTLDGIPESVMMGFMAKQQRLTKVLVVSIFIANFPEAFSAASMLKTHKTRSWKIMLMWFAVFINTGVLTLLGWSMMPSHVEHLSPTGKAIDIMTGAMEGLAGGAMLAMTSTAMLPEAFHGAGILSGLFFVSGFLVSVAVEECGILLSCHVSGRLAGQAEFCQRTFTA